MSLSVDTLDCVAKRVYDRSVTEACLEKVSGAVTSEISGETKNRDRRGRKARETEDISHAKNDEQDDGSWSAILLPPGLLFHFRPSKVAEGRGACRVQ